MTTATPGIHPGLFFMRRFSRRTWQISSGLFVLVALIAALWAILIGEVRTPGDLLYFWVHTRFLLFLQSGLASIALLSGLVFLFTVQARLNPETCISERKKQEFHQKIAEVKGLIKLGGPSRYQTAVITMDALLDRALTLHGYRGTLAEKLNRNRHRFRDMDAIWRAHRHRNRLVHEPGTPVHKVEAQASVEALAHALKDLGAL